MSKNLLFVGAAPEASKMLLATEHVVITSSAREISRSSPDMLFCLIFVDLDLPRDELICCSQRLRDGRNKKTPFIGLMKRNWSQYNESVLQLIGLSEYIQIPAGSERYKQTVNRWVV